MLHCLLNLSKFDIASSSFQLPTRDWNTHWCLPSVPDTWNELLYALIMKKHTEMDQNVSLSGTVTVNTG